MIAKPIAYAVAAAFMIATIPSTSATTIAAATDAANTHAAVTRVADATSHGDYQPSYDKSMHTDRMSQRHLHRAAYYYRPGNVYYDYDYDDDAFPDVLGDVVGGAGELGSSLLGGDSEAIAVCARTFRTFNPATGYYMSYSGPRLCPYLYQ